MARSGLLKIQSAAGTPLSDPASARSRCTTTAGPLGRGRVHDGRRPLESSTREVDASGVFGSIKGVATTCIASTNGSAWLSHDAGILASSWLPIEKIAVHDAGSGPGLYAAGLFDVVGGSAVDNVREMGRLELVRRRRRHRRRRGQDAHELEHPDGTQARRRRLTYTFPGRTDFWDGTSWTSISGHGASTSSNASTARRGRHPRATASGRTTRSARSRFTTTEAVPSSTPPGTSPSRTATSSDTSLAGTDEVVPGRNRTSELDGVFASLPARHDGCGSLGTVRRPLCLACRSDHQMGWHDLDQRRSLRNGVALVHRKLRPRQRAGSRRKRRIQHPSPLRGARRRVVDGNDLVADRIRVRRSPVSRHRLGARAVR